MTLTYAVENQRIKGAVTINGVKVSWSLGWRSHGEDDCERNDQIDLTADGPVALGEMRDAYRAAEKLEMSRNRGVSCCPYSDTLLEVVGVDNCGSVMLQIYRGDRKCSVAPASQLSHLDPTQYGEADEDAQRCVTWMRDVAAAYRDATTVRDLHDAIYAADHAAKDAATPAAVSAGNPDDGD
jgi:hypothetical protein